MGRRVSLENYKFPPLEARCLKRVSVGIRVFMELFSLQGLPSTQAQFLFKGLGADLRSVEFSERTGNLLFTSKMSL